MEQYLSDYRAPRTPAPIFQGDKEGDKGKGKDGKGGKRPATQFRRRCKIQDESVGKGETIDADWESWQEREDRIRRECEKSGEKFCLEDDWNIGERQAEDLRRAQDVAKYRKAKEAVDEAAKATTNYPQAAIVRADFLTNWTGTYDNIWTSAQTEQWRRDNLGSDEAWRRQQQEEWKKFTETQRERTNERNLEEDEADRSERRSRDSRDTEVEKTSAKEISYRKNESG